MQSTGREVVESIFGDSAITRPLQDVRKVRSSLYNQFNEEIHINDPFTSQESERHVEKNSNFSPAFDFRGVIEQNHVALLKGEPLAVPSINHPGRTCIVTSECHAGRFSISFFLDDDDLCFLVSVGVLSLFVFNISTATITFVNTYREKSLWIVFNVLAQLKAKKISQDCIFHDQTPNDRHAIVIGDERLGHYLRQSLGFIGKNLDSIVRFLDRGGEIWIVRDRCFVDPVRVFPELHNGKVVYLDCAQASFNFSSGLRFMHRIYRSQKSSLSYFDRLSSAENLDGQASLNEKFTFPILISLDVEKERFSNQLDCLASTVSWLEDQCRKKNQTAFFVFDGWAGKAFGENEKDREMIKGLSSLLGRIEGIGPDNSQTIFGLTVDEKIPVMRKCKLALAVHGAAAFLPSKALHIPTVTFNIPAVMGNMDEVNSKSVFRVEPEFLHELDGQSQKSPGFKSFSVDPIGIQHAIRETGVLQ